jgi:hypothetical protein
MRIPNTSTPASHHGINRIVDGRMGMAQAPEEGTAVDPAAE